MSLVNGRFGVNILMQNIHRYSPLVRNQTSAAICRYSSTSIGGSKLFIKSKLDLTPLHNHKSRENVYFSISFADMRQNSTQTSSNRQFGFRRTVEVYKSIQTEMKQWGLAEYYSVYIMLTALIVIVVAVAVDTTGGFTGNNDVDRTQVNNRTEKGN